MLCCHRLHYFFIRNLFPLLLMLAFCLKNVMSLAEWANKKTKGLSVKRKISNWGHGRCFMMLCANDFIIKFKKKESLDDFNFILPFTKNISILFHCENESFLCFFFLTINVWFYNWRETDKIGSKIINEDKFLFLPDQ